MYNVSFWWKKFNFSYISKIILLMMTLDIQNYLSIFLLVIFYRPQENIDKRPYIVAITRIINFIMRNYEKFYNNWHKMRSYIHGRAVCRIPSQRKANRCYSFLYYALGVFFHWIWTHLQNLVEENNIQKLTGIFFQFTINLNKFWSLLFSVQKILLYLQIFVTEKKTVRIRTSINFWISYFPKFVIAIEYENIKLFHTIYLFIWWFYI